MTAPRQRVSAITLAVTWSSARAAATRRSHANAPTSRCRSPARLPALLRAARRHHGRVSEERWFAVRCVFEMPTIAALNQEPEGVRLYEERLTVWRAASLDDAIVLAEQEADQYAGDSDRYLGLAQAYAMDEPPGHGTEVFSLLRNSKLGAEEYMSAFYDTGDEEQDDAIDAQYVPILDDRRSFDGRCGSAAVMFAL